ncbi:cyclophilin-like fold protein [Williamsia sp. Leaf354]|uniref:cyclophilin-like fold protein n=1 Tax=Williamsia sp. Leaf354 TaxID=1736349 RepID=UPI0012E34FE8|nr:cyclophilin-like fold protein [Williamsia sp. Leaf354]
MTQPEPTSPTTSTPTAGGPRACAGSETSTPIRIRFGGTMLTGSLDTSPAARALRDRLPITVAATDYGGVEKTAEIPALPMVDMPAGADPEPGTLGYYAPDRVLVFYYGDVGYFPGIAALGRFTDTDGVVATATGAVTVTVELDC